MNQSFDTPSSTPAYYLAIDLGATSGRSILATFDGNRVEMEELTRFRYPMLHIRNHLFWNMPSIYGHVLDAIKAAAVKLSAAGASLTSIGIDSWGCDVAYFYADGSLAGLPYCYRDKHTEGAIERFCSKMPRELVYEKTGIQFMEFNTLFQLDTLRSNNAGVIDAADKILFIPDALAYMLTGNAVTEYTVASTSQMLNPNTGDLDPDILSALRIPRHKFGPMVQPGDTIGTLTPEISELTGAGSIPVVAVAGHDTASAVIAVPSPDREYAYLSCGTWSLLGIESPSPIINDRSRAYNFTNEGGIDGSTRFLKNICGLWLLERCREEFTDAPGDIAELAGIYRQSDCESIINPDDPMFAHPTSMTEAISRYCAQTGQAVPQTAADYVRIIYRSLARRYKEVFDWLQELSPVELKRLHVIGGGSLNKYLMQYAADELGIPVVAGPTECTALGNVLVQLRASGSLQSLMQMRAVAINSTETITYKPQ